MTAPAQQASNAGTASAVAVEALTAELIALYAAAESQLLGEQARLVRLATSPSAPSNIAGRMRQSARRIAEQLRRRAQPLAIKIAGASAARGDRYAVRQLRAVPAHVFAQLAHREAIGELLHLAERRVELTPHGLAAANAIARELANSLGGVDQRILRFADDAYRRVVAGAATALVRDGITPAQAQRAAWQALTRNGVTGFVDRAGKQWNLASYVEMAVRTASQRAYAASHVARLTSLGVDLVTINHDGHPCPLCLPWEGRVLSLPSADEAQQTEAAASLAEATAAGLFHPNCRHVVVLYFAGVTDLGRASDWTPEDEARYRATQQLRELERQVRRAKRQQVAALTPLDARRAAREVRAAQAEIRLHVEQQGLVRRPRREQLDLGNK